MQILPRRETPPTFQDMHLHVDLRQQEVILDGETVRVTPVQYRLLALLVEHAGDVVTRATLLTQVWGYALQTRTRTLDKHIGQLRQKLGMHRRYIETVIGVGYRFRPLPGP